jgi:tRNA A37 N6-isopentenylltransferase MiaA
MNLTFSSFSMQIDNLLQQSKIPIIVGGTNYWIEAVLWKNLVSPGVGFKRKIDDDYEEELRHLNPDVREFIKDDSLAETMLQMDSQKLFEYLKVIDPDTANRLHPNNKRKIMR